MKSKKLDLKSSRYLGRIRGKVRRLSTGAIAAAERIAELAEPPMAEVKSSAVLERFLAANGFKVSRPWPDIPTAFRASAGVSRPRIALLAEYDALPDCGRRTGQWGHGCGHNLLGTAATVAGIAAADSLAHAGKGGRITVIGTPAEETLSGKVFLAERGAFRNFDAVLAWHPNAKTQVNLAGGAAMDSISFRFFGRTAHAAGAPHSGRSALDAALLMDVAVNYLREHVPENVRMHSVIPEGGKAPNVVPDRAEIWYYLRGRDRRQVDELRERVVRCARGAATATETRFSMTIHDCVTERIPNRALADMLDAILRRFGPPKFTAADARAAGRICRGKKYLMRIDQIVTEPGRASSDEDNVSWFAPLGRISVACVPEGTIVHHRQYAAMVRTPGAHRGMLRAAEVLAAGAVELAVNKSLLARAKDEFKNNKRHKQYKLPLSSTTPPVPDWS